jgi:hypothetical protein
MNEDVISSLDQISPVWLTHVLHRSGALTHGAVDAFEVVEARTRELSTNVRLRVRFSDDAQGAVPRRLFLKMVNTDAGYVTMGPSEVYYYTRDYIGVTEALMPRWYDAAYSHEQGRYHVLMDDLSETHVEASTRSPTLELGLALAAGLAAMHAHWWGAERLAEYGEGLPTAQQITHGVEISKLGVPHILAYCSDQLLPHWPEAIHAIFARHPQQLLARNRDANGYTIVHGDPNPHNILVPRVGERPIYLIDRQPFIGSALTGLGVFDLAAMMVLEWDAGLRRRFEVAILQHYHGSLIQHGVQEYTWDQLILDYRLSIPNCVYVTTEWCRGGVIERDVPTWLAMLQRSLTACDDWQVRELL